MKGEGSGQVSNALEKRQIEHVNGDIACPESKRPTRIALQGHRFGQIGVFDDPQSAIDLHDISNALQSEIDSVPGRVRRILRQRPEKEIPPGARIDSTEVEETVALIDFVATCRNYASELAINEVTLRTYSDLQQYVEQATEALVQSLRGGDAKCRAYRQMQVSAAIKFCEMLFGHDYASLMSRAAENALTGERKASRAS